jgi:hypothetical protein
VKEVLCEERNDYQYPLRQNYAITRHGFIIISSEALSLFIFEMTESEHGRELHGEREVPFVTPVSHITPPCGLSANNALCH